MQPRFQGQTTDPAPLGKPLRFHFSGKTASNCFLKSAITERMATWNLTDLSKRGIPTRNLINVYKRWGEGGSGLMITGNVMIELDHLEAQGNLVIPRGAPFSGERFDAYRALAAAGRAWGTLFLPQLSHPGRQTYSDGVLIGGGDRLGGQKLQPNPISASDVQLQGGFRGVTFAKPRAMEQNDLEAVIDGFAHAAEYSHKAGFDGVQLHAAHGYLLAQFLSFTTNKRTDEYGGSLRNRARIIFEISEAIRARVSDRSFILGIKINSVEFQKGGFSTEDCKMLCLDLENHGFDFVELSGGTYEAMAFQHVRESTKAREAFFLNFAEMIAPELTKTKTYVTGGLRTVHGMVKALSTVDGVGLARPVCHEFDLPKKILSGSVQGSLAYLLDERDYLLTDVAAGTQVRLVGDDRAPLDMTRQKHLEVFNVEMEKWLKVLTEDTEGLFSGWVDLGQAASGFQLQDYSNVEPY